MKKLIFESMNLRSIACLGMFSFLLYLAPANKLIAQKQVTLSPMTFAPGSTPEQRMNQIYAACDANLVEIDSLVEFILSGCTAPILVSMDAMRSSADPFDPNTIGADEKEVLGPPYQVKFEQEGMYIVFCDPSFKSVATCIKVVRSQTIPTMGEWGLIILGLCLCILGVVATKQSLVLTKAGL